MKTIHLCFCICLLLFLAQCKKTENQVAVPTYHDFETCLNSDLSQAEGSIQISTTVEPNGTVKIHTALRFTTNALFYSWNTGATSQSISVFPTQTTTYSVTVTEENACTAADSITIVVENCGN